ncbi:hypothetical protein WEI85_05815 [Actinomycetes bacterium KLBMP 9797]
MTFGSPDRRVRLVEFAVDPPDGGTEFLCLGEAQVGTSRVVAVEPRQHAVARVPTSTTGSRSAVSNGGQTHQA